MPSSIPSKSQLRSELRQRRQALGQQAQSAAARGVVSSVTNLPLWSAARRVALYLAADGEIDTGPLATRIRNSEKALFLPVIQADNSLRFAAWHSSEPLLSNRYGIPEPAPDAALCPVEELDIVFIPLVGWDRAGGRLGMGGGFYDRTLEGVRGPVLVGLAHDVQEVDNIPRENWDVPLDFIATDTTLYCCQGSN